MNLHYLSLVVVGFLVWFMGYCQGAPARPNFADATNKMKVYCGTILADALEAVCKGNYQTMRPAPTRKRTWKSKRDLNSQSDYSYETILSTSDRKRRRRGIYNECCEKPCTEEHLRLYCASPSDST